MVLERGEFVARKSAKFLDSVKLFFGDLADTEDPAQGDASISWDGTRFVIDTVLGIVHFGTAAQTVPSILHVFDGGAAAEPGAIALYDTDGVPWYFWVDSTGDLRRHSAMPTDAQADGVIVGTQS